MDVGPRSCHLCRDGVDLSDFSPSQREVVTAEDGPLSVLAGPGSGKTTVLAGRIAYLVDQRGISPSTIMAITFTTAAAATLRQRLAGVLGSAAQELTITTFHALGLRLIKQRAQELGFSHIPAVYGREDARALLRQAATGLGLEIAPENSGARRESLGHVDRETCRFARPVSARNLCRHSSNHQGAGHRR